MLKLKGQIQRHQQQQGQISKSEVFVTHFLSPSVWAVPGSPLCVRGCDQRHTPALGPSGQQPQQPRVPRSWPRRPPLAGRRFYQTAGGVTHLLPRTRSCPTKTDRQVCLLFTQDRWTTFSLKKLAPPDLQTRCAANRIQVIQLKTSDFTSQQEVSLDQRPKLALYRTAVKCFPPRKRLLGSLHTDWVCFFLLISIPVTFSFLI